VSGQRHAQAVLYPREKTPGTHCTGGWVGLRAGLDTEDRGKILCLCWGSNPGRPVCSHSGIVLTELLQLIIIKINNFIIIIINIIIVDFELGLYVTYYPKVNGFKNPAAVKGNKSKFNPVFQICIG
jgi:hypothetical protein